MVATVAEACLLAAKRLDERHQEHVAIGLSVATATVKAVFDAAPVPFHIGSVIGEFLDPFKDTIMHKENNKYTKKKLVDGIQKEFGKIVADATAGYIVPGLNNQNARSFVHTVEVPTDLRYHQEERKAWGKQFAEWFEDIRKYA